jgi:hypothetical protein
MAKLIALPDGSTGSFPDDMDDGAITAVLRKQFPPKESAPNPAEGMSATERFMTGVGGSAARLRDKIFPPGSPIDALTMSQTGDNGRARKADLATYEANKEALGTAGKAGEITGEVAATAIPIGRAASLGGKVLAKTLGRMAPATADILANAGYAAGTAEPGERDSAALAGGAGAAGGRLLARTLGGLARPFISKEAQTLIDKGVRPTPGQLFGDGPIGSAIRGIEDSATSIPLVGSVIKYARGRSISEYGNAEINAALKPLGVTVKGSGAEAVEQAQRAVSATYDKVLPQTVIRPQNVSAALAKVLPDIDSIPLLTTEQGSLVRQYVARKIAPTVQEAAERGTPISGEIANRIDSEIGFQARKFSSALDPAQHSLGEAFYTLQASLRDTVEGATPEATKVLTQARTAYRNLLPIVSAADKTTPGQFTPRQLNRAAGQFDQTPSPLNRAGQNVLPSTVPDSGTGGRTLLGLAMASGAVNSYAAPAALAAAFYSGPGMRLLVNGLRTKMAPDLYATIVKLAPQQQAALLTKMAQTNPQLEAQVAEAAKQVVAQIGRSMAVQGGQDVPPQ